MDGSIIETTKEDYNFKLIPNKKYKGRYSFSLEDYDRNIDVYVLKEILYNKK